MSAQPAQHANVSPDAAYREEWRPFEQDPGPLLFLLGCQRSGTTWLHLQLARSGAFRYLSAHEVLAADSLVHQQRAGLAAAARAAFDASLQGEAGDRGIDTIPARANTPEEYGLVINAGALRYEHSDTTDATLPLLRELCAKKALLEGRARPLLLKSPPDYPAALPLLRQSWPQARFIALQRHPLHTLQSQLRAWRELLLRRNAYLYQLDQGYRALFDDSGRRLQLGLFLHSKAGIEWLADCILRAHLGFLQQLDEWHGAPLLTLRYEDLCSDQHAGFAAMSAYLAMELPLPTLAPAPRATPVASEVRDVFAARTAAFAPYLQRFGYSAEGGA